MEGLVDISETSFFVQILHAESEPISRQSSQRRPSRSICKGQKATSKNQIETLIMNHSVTFILLLAYLPFALTLPMLAPSARMETERIRTLPKDQCLSQKNLICAVRPTDGNNVRGTVRFRPRYLDGGDSKFRCVVAIFGGMTGLSEGAHGFHVHMYGDVSSNDGLSTGGHFDNPEGAPLLHALPAENGTHHWGDLGNVFALDGEQTWYHRVNMIVTLPSILGRALIVHELRDLGSAEQPTGAAGSRLASCVIGFAYSETS